MATVDIGVMSVNVRTNTSGDERVIERSGGSNFRSTFVHVSKWLSMKV